MTRKKRSARMTMHPAVTNGAYDVARIREDFPILAMQVYGKPLVYLDNAASAQKPKAVLERITHGYTAEYANVHRGLHYLANAATEAYEDAREKVRAFLNAARKEEIIFTRNATEAINLVAYTFGRERIKPGDEIVLSIMEHHSNVVPWHFRSEEIIFTRNATEAINLVAYTFGRERIKPGDEIVLSIMEHHSNVVPWHF